MRALALFVSAIAAVQAEFNPVQTVMGIPSAVRGGLTRFREGTGDMWANGKAAGSIRKRIQKGGEPASYPELVLLRKSGEDLGKLVQAGVMCVVAPEYIPFALVFYPNALPSTFERPKGRERRLATLGRLRTKAVLDLVIKLEEQAVKPRQNKKTEQARALSEQASAVLRASGPSAALKTLPAALSPAPPPKKPGKKPPPATLKGVPDPLLKAGCTLIGAGPAPLGFLRRAALQKHLGHLAEEVRATWTVSRCATWIHASSRRGDAPSLSPPHPALHRTWRSPRPTFASSLTPSWSTRAMTAPSAARATPTRSSARRSLRGSNSWVSTRTLSRSSFDLAHSPSPPSPARGKLKTGTYRVSSTSASERRLAGVWCDSASARRAPTLGASGVVNEDRPTGGALAVDS